LNNKKLLFLVTEDWYFMSHRASLAATLKSAGYEIALVTQTDQYQQKIHDLDIDLAPICFPRSLKRPWQDVLTCIGIFRAYRKIKPDIIHHVSLKPIVYGSLMLALGAGTAKNPVVVNAFTGLGFVFTSDKFSARLIRGILIPMLKMLTGGKNSYLLFQNEEDKQTMVELGVASADHCYLIPGSGVDVHEYRPQDEPGGVPVLMLVSRMLYDKGVEDFVHAVRLVKGQGIEARFVLVGDTDPENPAAIPVDILQTWSDEGMIEWRGRQENMPEVYSQAHVVVLPSHREGFPKTVIEASACSRPVITTDVPGCRDAISPDETGLLVPVKDPVALADAMIDLINNQEKRTRMGKAGRKLVEEKYSTDIINSQFLDLYNNLMKKKETRLPE